MKNRKKVFLSLLIIAGVSVLAIAATRAFFSARARQTGNRFTMGTLDVQIGANPQAEPFVVDNIGEDGTITGQKVWRVRNTGTLPGRLFVRLRNVVNNENGCNDPEISTEPNCESDNLGEMGSKLATGLYFKNTAPANNDVSDMSLVGSNHTLATADADTFGADWSAQSAITIPPGGERYIGIKWDAAATSYGNEIQSDSTEFEVEANLVQVATGQPTPTNTN